MERGDEVSKKKNKMYQVYFNVNVETVVEISAQSYEEALSKAREYDVKDIVEFDTVFNDGSVQVVGVYNPNEEAT